MRTIPRPRLPPTVLAIALLLGALAQAQDGRSAPTLADTILAYEKLLQGQPDSPQAAGLFFDLGQHYEDRNDVAKLKQHYAEYLKTWADKGGTDRRIIAEVKLGELAWRSSCPAPGVSGACVDVKRERSGPALAFKLNLLRRYSGFGRPCRPTFRPSPCAPETKALITVHARNPALVNEAMAHFQTALRLHESAAVRSSQPGGHPLPKDRLDMLAYHVARARMAKGDVLYEEFLQMKPPPGLAFNPKDKAATSRARQRLADWMNLAQRKLDGAKEKYEQVITLKVPYFTIAAAARIGQMYVAFADGLYRAEVPAPPPPPPLFAGDGCERNEWRQMSRDAFCDHMVDAAEPLEGLAKEHLLACLRKSTELVEVNEWSRVCEEELYQLDPREYPLPKESLFEPSNASRILDVAPLQLAGTEK